jgi:lipopolysaccharide export LptBFGC system permease protein LptF
VRGRRLGCQMFGILWALVFGFTNFGLALGGPVDRSAINPLSIVFWIEIAVLVVAGWLFYRAEMKDREL